MADNVSNDCRLAKALQKTIKIRYRRSFVVANRFPVSLKQAIEWVTKGTFQLRQPLLQFGLRLILWNFPSRGEREDGLAQRPSRNPSVATVRPQLLPKLASVRVRRKVVRQALVGNDVPLWLGTARQIALEILSYSHSIVPGGFDVTS